MFLKSATRGKCFFLSASVLLLFSLMLYGCESATELSLQNHSWQFRIVQSGKDGSVLACSAAEKGRWDYSAVEIKTIVCEVTDRVFTIRDQETQRSYNFVYAVDSVQPDSTIYSLTSDREEGYASVGRTKYADGEREYTLTVRIGEYALCFSADESHKAGK